MESKNRLEHITQSLVEFRKLWLIPAIIGLILATIYAFFIQGETWTSRQTMIIRDDLLGETFKPGQFLNEEAMKSAQETVLETARRPEVIRTTLERLGPERNSLLGLGGVPSGWPSREVIEDYRGSVSFESANGGEFGKSEVIVLAAKSSNADRAIKFLMLLTEEIDGKLAEVRANRFESMESELRATCEGALQTRSSLEKRIMEMDESFGTDISVVQSMNVQSGGNPSAFDNKLNDIRAKRREAKGQILSLRSFKELLLDAQHSNAELPTSSELLASQPALAELVTGLAKAKDELSAAEASYTSRHTRVKTGRDKVAAIKRQIKKGIPAFISGFDGQIAVLESKIRGLDGLMEENAELIRKISSQRVPYKSLEGELAKQTENYANASARLAQVEARKIASSSIQLLTRVGEPWVGTRADGLGKRVLALVGGIAGLIIGLGLVMIVAPPFVDPTPGQIAATNFHPQDPAIPESPSAHDERLSRLSERVAQHEQAKTLPAEPPASTPVTPAPVAVAPADPVPATDISPAQMPVAKTPVPAQATQTSVPAQATQTSVPVSVAEQASSAAKIVPAPTAPTPAPSTPTPAPASNPPVSSSTQFTAAGMAFAGAAGIAGLATAEPTTATEAVADIEIPDTTVSTEETAQPQTETAVQQRPASRTLAAIFANMPQPRTDATTLLQDPGTTETLVDVAGASEAIDSKIDALSAELRDSLAVPEPEAETGRIRSETIQLDEVVSQSALPLQRRASVRPVDLARVEESNVDELNRENIDSAFSQLDQAPPSNPRQTPESEIDDLPQ